MKIINNQNIYETLYFKLSYILYDKNYRKLRNDNYKPDDYLGFLNDDETCFIPLICKKNLVTFYGGIFYNENNYIPKKYINFVLNYLIEKNYDFRLINLNNDIYNELGDKYKIYDVPYNNKWFIENIQNFDINSHYENLKKISTKKARRIKISLKKESKYFLENILNNYDNLIDDIINIINSRFLKKNKKFDWVTNINLLKNILNYFKKDNNLYFYVMHNENQQNIGWFCCIKYHNKIQNILFNIINRTYENDVIILFIKMIEVLKNNNEKYFDFMNGSFGYKNICGCDFQPVFALVKDSNWTVQYNQDVEKDIIIKKIGREFGYFKKLE